MLEVSASILSFDFASLGSEVRRLEEAGSNAIHIDVMDGCFVDNITIGYDVIKSIRGCSNIEFDVHLMMSNPESLIHKFIDSGANTITVHPETVKHLDSTIKKIKYLGASVGVALLPTTHESILEYIIHDIDLVLVMTVNPGFGGQSFLNSQIPKIKKIRQIIDNNNPNVILSVDGGINNVTAQLCVNNGAKRLVSGSYLAKDLNNILKLKGIKPQ